ncbi:MAG: VIT1/CCC1 transporter family protein [Ilumatobacteraceae bacterium]|nr:VIT1/CCC1 transporter family protein [Ilumatobacteraceae bacterium]MCX6527459.1 VIT1/CCC1 transporter family protein [Actinomycetota bacterium]
MARTRDPHPGHRSVSGGLARAAIFGISDGLVSNVSLVIGIAGGGVSTSIVRLAGLAGAVAGAASMAAGEWVSVSAQNELIQREVEMERREIVNNPEFETLELAAFYEGHGMSKEQAASAAQEVMSKPELALIVHAREEFGIDVDDLASPPRVAAVSFICFIVGALLPVLPWYIGSGAAAKTASVLIGVFVAAIVGGFIGKSAERSIARTSLRQVLILLVACGVTYSIGLLLNTTVT